MPKTSVELVDTILDGIVPIHLVRATSHCDGLFPLMIGLKQRGMVPLEPVEPFKSHLGLVTAWRSSAMERFNRNAIFGHPVSPIGHTTRRGLCDAVFHGVKPTDRFKELHVCHTSLFKDPYIRLTVSQQFILKTKMVVIGFLLCVPGLELPTSTFRHTTRIIMVFFWHTPLVQLVFPRVEERGKKPFFSSVSPKVLGNSHNGI